MLYLECNYNGGLLFKNTMDAMAFADAMSRAIPVSKDGWGKDEKFTRIDENPIRQLIAVKPNQLVEPEIKTEPAVAEPLKPPAGPAEGEHGTR